MASSRRLLAVALLAMLVAGAWCAAPVTFTVEKGSDTGSGKKQLTVLVSYDMPGDTMSELEIMQHDADDWVAMTKGEGGLWTFESADPLVGPFNFRYFTKKGLKNVYDNVIPDNYTIGTTYTPQG
ncbi:unnamed protein product [Triticum turgidum subsp. durum]|uniref:Expansin-like CBD domain-containing protein n=1 Tax=Triticum turgidum subsp. durum TaxID=4567 RepID=A0A9R0TC62_TRITD|nr:unnamed protein product [Triticum turgidum subsp. durum]